VLDFVPLAGAGWQVVDDDVEAEFVGQLLQFVLSQPHPPAVAAFYPFNAFRSLQGISGQEGAPTYDGLYTGSWQHPKCSGKNRASI
jgi:hypothetical protein